MTALPWPVARAAVVGHERRLPPVGVPPPGPLDVAVAVLVHRAVWPTVVNAALVLELLGWADGRPRTHADVAASRGLTRQRVTQLLVGVRGHAWWSGPPASLAPAVELVEHTDVDHAPALLRRAGLVDRTGSAAAVHATADLFVRAGRPAGG